MYRVFKHRWDRVLKGAPAYEFMEEHAPALASISDPVEYAVQFWLDWTAFMEDFTPDLSYKIEDGEAGILKALEMAGYEIEKPREYFRQSHHKNINTTSALIKKASAPILTWDDVPATIRKKAKSYGYDV